MITFVPPVLTEPVWKPLDLGNGDSIEIAVRRPTLSDQLTALETGVGGVLDHNLKSAIADWRGVNDPKGNPVPYSWQALTTLCVSYPLAIWELLAAVREVTKPTGDPLGNSPAPPANGGMPTPEETADTTQSSVSTAIFDASNDYKTTSD